MLAYVLACLFVFAVPWENVVVFPGLGTLSKLLGIAAFGATALHVLLNGKVRRPTAFHYIAFTFLCWIVTSSFWGVNTSCHPVYGCAMGNAIRTYVQIFVMLWILWETTSTRSRLTGLFQAYVLGAYVAAGSTIYNFATGAMIADAYGRFAASGFDPNDLGALLALALPMAWYLASTASGGTRRWLNRAYFVVGTLAILLTGSRGALLAALTALIVVPWTLTQVRRGVRVAAVVIMLGSGAAAVRFVPTNLFERLSTTTSEITEGTMNSRLKIWKMGIAAVPARPFRGFGPAGWEAAVSRIRGSHNTYLSVLVEEGLIGLILFLGAIAAVFKRLLPLATFERRVTLTLLATLLVAMTPLEWDTKKAAWLVLALLAAASDTLAPARRAGAGAPVLRGYPPTPSRPPLRPVPPVIAR